MRDAFLSEKMRKSGYNYQVWVPPRTVIAVNVGRDDPARRLAVGKGMQLPANGTPSGRALQKHVSFTVVHS